MLHQDEITDTEADELARLLTLADPGRLRTDPPVSAQLARNDLRPSVATFSFTYYALFDGDTLLGLADAFGTVNAENSDLCEILIMIDPDHLDQGLHRQLFDHVEPIERSRGRTRFWGWGDLSHVATCQFWKGELGYTLAYDERISRCTLADVDAALMQHWVDLASDRAGGYELIHAEAPLDDRQLALFAQGLEAMNDAPLDALEMEAERFDVGRAREIEALHLATKSSYRAVFAVERSSGELAGYTSLRIPDAEPALSKQGDTVTIATHRNRGIGRWLKADMWQWLRHDRPDVEYLDTGNAESNRAMLSINEAMGFRAVLHHGIWHSPPT